MNFFDIRNQFRDYCLIERGMTAKNHKTIVRHMGHLLDYLGTENIRRVKENGIREYLSVNSKNRLWSPKTYITYLQSFKSYFNWALKRGLVKTNPAEGIEKPRLPKRLPRCLSRSEIQTIFEYAIQYNWQHPFERTRNLAILHTFLYTGMRLNELLHLRVSDVNIDAQEIYIHKGKGGKNRTVPIHPQLSSVLRGYVQSRNNRNVFSKWFFTGIHSDKRLYEKNVLEICKKISLKSGIKFTPHMLRHTFARFVCDADMNLYKLKEILGHSNVSTTQIYLSVSHEGIKKSLKSVPFL